MDIFCHLGTGAEHLLLILLSFLGFVKLVYFLIEVIFQLLDLVFKILLLIGLGFQSLIELFQVVRTFV